MNKFSKAAVLAALVLVALTTSVGAAFTNKAVSITGGIYYGSTAYSVGWRFRTTSNLTVRALGVYDANAGGLSVTHTVRLYNATANTIVTTVTVPSTTPGEAAGGYTAHFVNVTPFTLVAGSTYLIAQNKATDGYLYDVTVSPGAGVIVSNGVGYAGNLPASVSSFNINANNSYFGPNFKFLSATPAPPTISRPLSRAVYQRNSNNVARVAISGSCVSGLGRIEARAVRRAGFKGTTTAWTTVANSPGTTYAGSLTVAGGWYDIEVRAISGSVVSTSARVERVGVGEIFITCGQSNSANYGVPAQQPTDDRVNALNLNTSTWQKANDPQPYATGANGSAWPDFGDMLALRTETPVAVVAVGVGSTRVAQWVPVTGGLYPRLALAINGLKPYGGFRAILWHQGESDGIDGTPAATYAARLNSIIAQSRTDAGFAVPWGVALASYLSSTTVYNQAQVIAGQRLVIANTTGAFKGAETDAFHLRGWLSDGVHFNDLGLRDHGRQWVDAVWKSELADDRDRDGMPDLWMLMHFGHADGRTNDLSVATADADGDGVNNRNEYRATTDPRDPMDYLRVSEVTFSNGQCRFTWFTVPGRTYQAQWTGTLTNALWPQAGTLTSSYGASLSFTDAPAVSVSNRFYRIRVIQ